MNLYNLISIETTCRETKTKRHSEMKKPLKNKPKELKLKLSFQFKFADDLFSQKKKK